MDSSWHHLRLHSTLPCPGTSVAEGARNSDTPQLRMQGEAHTCTCIHTYMYIMHSHAPTRTWPNICLSVHVSTMFTMAMSPERCPVEGGDQIRARKGRVECNIILRHVHKKKEGKKSPEATSTRLSLLNPAALYHPSDVAWTCFTIPSQWCGLDMFYYTIPVMWLGHVLLYHPGDVAWTCFTIPSQWCGLDMLYYAIPVMWLGHVLLYHPSDVAWTCFTIPSRWCGLDMFYYAIPVMWLGHVLLYHPSDVAWTCFTMPSQWCGLDMFYYTIPVMWLGHVLLCHPSDVAWTCFTIPSQWCGLDMFYYAIPVVWLGHVAQCGSQSIVQESLKWQTGRGDLRPPKEILQSSAAHGSRVQLGPGVR